MWVKKIFFRPKRNAEADMKFRGHRFLFPAFFLILFSARLLFADTVYLYDRSGSMSEAMDGLRKIEIARDAFSAALLRMPDRLPVGLMSFPDDGNCGVPTVVSLKAVSESRSQLDSSVRSMEPGGSTPLAQAIETAGQMFRQRQEINRIIVITDGLETCGGDPEAAARKWHNAGLNIIIHIISFAMSDADRLRLEAVAKAGGGMYINVGRRDDAFWGLSGLSRLGPGGRCEETRSGSLVIGADGFVRDRNSTGAWSMCAAGQTYEMCACRGAPAFYSTREKAAAACRVSAGRSARLPTIDELQTLIFRRNRAPFLDTSIFPSLSPHRYWSSSVFGDDMTSVYDFQAGHSETIDSEPALARCMAR